MALFHKTSKQKADSMLCFVWKKELHPDTNHRARDTPVTITVVKTKHAVNKGIQRGLRNLKVSGEREFIISKIQLRGTGIPNTPSWTWGRKSTFPLPRWHTRGPRGPSTAHTRGCSLPFSTAWSSRGRIYFYHQVITILGCPWISRSINPITDTTLLSLPRDSAEMARKTCSLQGLLPLGWFLYLFF